MVKDETVIHELANTILKFLLKVTKQNRLLLARHMVEAHNVSEDVAERRIRDDYSHLKLDDPR